MSSSSKSRTDPCRCYCVDLPLAEYQRARHLQLELVAARKDKTLKSNILLILEHPPVFTFGRRGGIENLLVSKTFLEKAGIGLVQVERGGSITFHGLGQLVAYPILDLQTAGIGISDYVNRLEEVMLRTAAGWGVHAQRNPLNRGVWVNSKKMGSVGVAVRRGISFHGLSLNVNISLEPFSWIHPCGLEGVQVTSLAKESNSDVSMSRVRSSLKSHFKEVFNVQFATPDRTFLQRYFSGLTAQARRYP